jgi:hypothetical protein
VAAPVGWQITDLEGIFPLHCLFIVSGPGRSGPQYGERQGPGLLLPAPFKCSQPEQQQMAAPVGWQITDLHVQNVCITMFVPDVACLLMVGVPHCCS